MLRLSSSQDTGMVRRTIPKFMLICIGFGGRGRGGSGSDAATICSTTHDGEDAMKTASIPSR